MWQPLKGLQTAACNFDSLSQQTVETFYSVIEATAIVMLETALLCSNVCWLLTSAAGLISFDIVLYHTSEQT